MSLDAAQHEFSPEHESDFRRLATRMRGVGFWFEVYGFLMIGVFVVRLIPRDGGFTIAPFDLITGLLFLFLGHWTRRGGKAFQRIAETRGGDLSHLMSGVGELSKLYGLIDRLILLAIVLVVVGLLLAGLALLKGGI